MGKGWNSGRSIENPPFQNMQKVGLPVSFFLVTFARILRKPDHGMSTFYLQLLTGLLGRGPPNRCDKT